MFLASFARGVTGGCQMAPLPEQADDEPADRSQTQTCGHQSGTAHALHDPRLPDEGAARWMRHTHRIVSTMRFHRYRQKAKSGPCSGTRRTRPALLVVDREISSPATASGFRVVGVVVQKALLKNRSLARGERAENALEVFHRSELDSDLALLLAQIAVEFASTEDLERILSTLAPGEKLALQKSLLDDDSEDTEA